MRSISLERASRFLGCRADAFVAKFGDRHSYHTATVLAFAGMLIRPVGSPTLTILLPWQVAKQWEQDRGVKLLYRRGQPTNSEELIPVVAPAAYAAELANLFYFPPGDAEPTPVPLGSEADFLDGKAHEERVRRGVSS